MNTDRANILHRVASGEMSADEAARLLNEMPRPALPPAALTGRWLRVRVTDMTTGKQRINVNLPLAWVEVGLSLGARFRPELAGLDLADLLAQIRAGTSGKLVEVEDLEDDERIEVFVD